MDNPAMEEQLNKENALKGVGTARENEFIKPRVEIFEQTPG